jgi:epoxyqueuosine reductase QueG
MTAESQSMEELARSIKGLAGASTADLVGIAPGSEFSAAELGELGEAFGEVKSIVVLAQRIVDPVQMVRFYAGQAYQESHVATSFADAMLKSTCWQVVEVLHQAGVRAAAPRNLRYGDAAPRHSLSFKKAAVLAGFGAFGRNQLVIHPKWGPWMMLRTVVTDAPLPPDAPMDFAPCDHCSRCLQACPAGALSENGIDRDACRDQAGYVRQSSTVIRLSPHGRINCDECLRACPIGAAPPRLALAEAGS